MLTVLASTIALALALGPQLQINLQAALDETPTVETQVDAEEAPAESETMPTAEILPLDEVEETRIEENEITQPELTLPEEPAKEAPAPEASTGDVPAEEWPAILDAASAALAAAETASGKFMLWHL